MKEIFKHGAGLFGKLIVVTLMCFFLCISMSVLCTAAFTKNIGYKAYGTKDGSSDAVYLYTYNNEDGEDTQKAEYEAQGYTVTTSSVRSTLSGSGNKVFLIVTQLFCLAMVVVFVYPKLWHLGTQDNNLVRFKHKKEDKLKGLKIGLVSSVPSLLSFIALVLCGKSLMPKLPLALYRFLHCGYFSMYEIIFRGAQTAGELGFLQYLAIFALLLIVPAVACGAYLLGYHDISLGEHLIYKNNKKSK